MHCYYHIADYMSTINMRFVHFYVNILLFPLKELLLAFLIRIEKINIIKIQTIQGWDCNLALCLGVGKPASKAAKLIVWESKSGRSAPCQVPWSECTMDFVLKMSKATSCDYYFGTAGRNLVCQDFCAGCCKPLPLLSHLDSVIEPHTFL